MLDSDFSDEMLALWAGLRRLRRTRGLRTYVI